LKYRDASRSRTATADDQRDVIDFLSRPSSYTAAVELALNRCTAPDAKPV
jgi:hypothetical protein